MKNTIAAEPYTEECDKAYQVFILGQFKNALDMYESILTDCPDCVRALHGIGVVLHKMGKSEEGIAYIRKALDLKPDFADAYFNLGNILIDVCCFNDAVDCFRKTIKLKPNNDKVYKNLALALLKSRHLDEAFHAASRALEINSQDADNIFAMSTVYEARGDVEKALQMYLRVLEFAADSTNAHSNVLHTMNYLTKTTQRAIYLESRRWEKYHASGRLIHRPFLNSPVPDRRLRIGYVSGDFKLHPVSHHFKPVIESHDRKRYEIFLYNNFPHCDEMSEKLAELADHWRNIESLSDEHADEMIRLDGIDILVDLSGHTGFNRLLLFARRPAPVQVSWIGYFNTTGMSAMDYLLSDAITIPPGEESLFSEQVLRLPNGRFCYEPPDFAYDVADLPALRNGFITFGSFNKISKITPETVALWCAALKAVPGARIVIKTAALEAESLIEPFLERFEKNGVERVRVELRKESPHLEMLEQYGDIDISLDTYPFNGGATTCESLWMGVPVVTLSGHTPISRQSASLLAGCGLSQLVADTPSGFIGITKRLTADLGGLARLRSSLRERLSSSPLCNSELFTNNLERAFRDMWKTWCGAQKKPLIDRVHPAISADEYYNAGIIRMEEKDYNTALMFFGLAVRKKPDFAEAHNNLGICRFNLGKEYHKQAVSSIRRAIRLKPAMGEAFNNLGRVLTEMKCYSQAVRICRKAVELMPDNPDAYTNLGIACREKGLYMEALSSFEMSVELNPSDVTPFKMIAVLKLSNGDPVGAIDYFRKASQLQPENPDIHSNILFAMNYVSSYSQQDIYEESCTWDSSYGEQSSGLDFSGRLIERDRLRVGYVSADFYHHPVGIFFQAVARNHDKNNFEMVCYSNGGKTDEVNKDIKKYTDQWREIKGISDDELFALIHRDMIDILVDLSGHTDGNRLRVFSRRAAPVQVSWLGYYNTTGLSQMDYVISDFDTVPPGCEQWYRESVIRMPDSRFCYTPPLICPDVEPLPARKNGYVTFGCFNNIAKLTPEVIEVWAEILRKLPDSRLVLKWKSLSDGAVRDYYRLLFSMHGIPRRRIEFRGQSPLFMMRDEYNDIDIALDPFPFTGGITSCEALWMGVPVVTLAGERPAGRQTTGFLRVIGLDELISETHSDYVDCAVRLSADIDRLAVLRQGLREMMASSPLCDGVGFTRKLEDIYRNIWQTWIDKAGGLTKGHQ